MKGVRTDATIAGPLRLEVRGGRIEHRESGQRLEIDTVPRIIGRSHCDFPLDDRAVSAAHCELVATERGVRVRDLGSRNGTTVSGVRIGEAYLTKAARITLGKTALEFIPGESTAQPLPKRFGRLESQSPRMQAVFELLSRIAPTSANVHLTGESGTGKGYIARKIHEQSKRSAKPFVVIDLAQIAPNLIESALFGHEKGAFTGALRASVSPFVEANGGTVFLDEIGDLPLELQKKLLRVIDEKVIQRVGSTRTERVDVRILSATWHNLQERVNRKEFRDDLYYRLGTRIALPSLSERREDIELITRQILDDMGRSVLFAEIPPTTMEWATHHTWEGNLRGLRQALELAADLHDNGGSFDIEAAFRTSRGHDSPAAPARHLLPPAAKMPSGLEALVARGATLAEVEGEARRVLFTKLHTDCLGVVSEIARRASVSRRLAREELARIGLGGKEEAWKTLRQRKASL